MGESAGAFAALAAGITNPGDFADDGPGFPAPPENNPGVSPLPVAIIDFWGSADLIRDEFDAGDPPIMIAHGTNDLTLGTFFTSALTIVAACNEHGIPCRFFPLIGQDHGAWDAKFDGKGLVEHTMEFLADYMP